MLLTDITRGSKKSQSTSTQLLIIQEAHRSGAVSLPYRQRLLHREELWVRQEATSGID